MDLWDDVFPSIIAQEMDKNGYQMSNLEVIECHGEDPDVNMDAVFCPGIDTPFSTSTFEKFEMCSRPESPLLIDEDEYK